MKWGGLMESVEVNLGARSYDIVIENGALNRIGSWAAGKTRGRRVLIVADENSAALFAASAQERLLESGLATSVSVLPPGEGSKSLDGAETIYSAAIQAGLDREDTILALGGGVVGDVSGFAAATYLRGISLLQVPTTLLSQVDSSVGGKVAVNHKLGKNLIGAFYQPRGVLIDPLTLVSLSEREFCSGLAEVLKYGLIADVAFFNNLAKDSTRILQREPERMESVIAHSCRMKAAVVERDEYDTGERAMLNFGHTVGHAVEAVGHFQRHTHGEAVALGMLAATRLSELRAGLAIGATERVRSLLKAYRLPVELLGVSAEALLGFMSQDKKRSADKINWVLLKQLGQAESMRDISDETVKQALQVILRVG